MFPYIKVKNCAPLPKCTQKCMLWWFVESARYVHIRSNKHITDGMKDTFTL